MTLNVANQPVTGAIDPLTGLASRTGFESYLKDFEASGASVPLSIISMELSRFGNINDSMGADIGNKIISSIAKRLLKIFPNVAEIANPIFHKKYKE